MAYFDEDDPFAEDRGRLGNGQRRAELEDAARPGQRGVDAVAKLVGQHPRF